MIALGIETSSARGGTALVELQHQDAPARVLAEVTIESGMRHAEALLPALEQCLAEAGCTLRSLDLIVAGTGPGSYTGTRLGLAFARALAFANEIELAGLASFDAIAEAIDPKTLASGRELLVARDAYQQRVYRARYRARETEGSRPAPLGVRYERLGPIELVGAAAFWEGVEREVALAGDVTERLPELAAACTGACLPAEHAHARANVVAAIGLRRHLAGERMPPSEVAPLYLRPPLGG